MKTVLVLLGLLACASAGSILMESQYEVLFSSFMKQYHKTYKADEFQYRYSVFKTNLDFIIKSNAEGHGWTLRMNHFGDLTWDEFRHKYIGGIRPKSNRAPDYAVLPEGNVPDSVDWRQKGAVTPVKNQEQCGSCWAFSAVGALEGICELKTGKLWSLSEQQLVDCSSSFGNEGCNGGLMDQAFQYIKQNKGLCTEEDYPYTAQDDDCKADQCTPKCPITGFKDVVKTEAQLQQAVAIQPVSVAIEADQMGFQFYSSGVFDGDCGTSLDHGVLAVGYGTQDGKPMWIVKNSWGSDWGMNGYILLVRNKKTQQPQGQCGIAMMASYPTM